MADITMYHGTVKELITVVVKVDGVAVTSGYQLCILPDGTEPTAATPSWQTPDTAGTDTGIFVGTGTSNSFARGATSQTWFWLVSSPESVIERADPKVLWV